MGEITVLTKARPNSNSLRTTVPRGVVKHLGLRRGKKIIWQIKGENGLVAIVKGVNDDDRN